MSKNLLKRSKGNSTTSTGCDRQNSELIGWNKAASMSVMGSEPDIWAYGGEVGRTICSTETRMLIPRVVAATSSAVTVLEGRSMKFFSRSESSSSVCDCCCSS
jgi:hypothetical protein